MSNAPIPVLATHIDGRVMEFESCGAAARWVVANQPSIKLKPDASIIARRVKNKQELDGWTFTLGSSSSSINPMTFVFGEDAADLFKGKSVRVTNENPKRVSVFDVIKIVSDVDNPRQTFDALCARHEEVILRTYNFKFPGAGQRATPVTDVSGLMHIINLLPGENAARFRAGTVNLLVRFLGGDTTLVDEVMAINEAHTSGATEGTGARARVQEKEIDANVQIKKMELAIKHMDVLMKIAGLCI